MKTLALSLLLAGASAGSQTRCCDTCELPKVKYYSVDHIFKHCGESCMDPKDYWKYKIFEPGLTLANGTNTPCADLQWPVFYEEETHGFGPIKMDVDLFNHNATAEAVPLPDEPEAV